MRRPGRSLHKRQKDFETYLQIHISSDNVPSCHIISLHYEELVVSLLLPLGTKTTIPVLSIRECSFEEKDMKSKYIDFQLS